MREGRLKNLIKTGILGKDIGVTCETHYGLTFCNEGSSKGMTTPLNPLIILNFIFRIGREVRRRLHSLHPDQLQAFKDSPGSSWVAVDAFNFS